MAQSKNAGARRIRHGTTSPVSPLLLLFVLAGTASPATNLLQSQYGSRIWQTDEGLPHNYVQALVQTRDGYLWLGTQYGLARFDGVRFTIFNNSNVPQMRNANILGLHESKDGSLWMITGTGGLNRLKDGRFFHFGKAEGLVADEGLEGSILEDSQGSLWFRMVGGVSRYKDGKFVSFSKQTGFFSNVVRGMCEDTQGRFWCATAEGVFCWKDGRVLRHLTTADGLGLNDVRAICSAPDGTLWVGAGNGLSHIQEDKISTCTLDPRPTYNMITHIYFDKRGNLWVGCFNGLYRFVDGKFVAQLDDRGQDFDKVNAILEDHERNLWLGSREGLVQLRQRRFTSYTQQEGLTCNNVVSVLEGSDGTIWAGTWGGGLSRFKDGLITGLTNSQLAPLLVLGLMQDRAGRLWVGTDWEGRLFRLEQGAFRSFTAKQGLTGGAIRVIYEDRQGTCWIGASGGLYRKRGERFEPFGRQHGMGAEVVRAICEDADGALWIGTNSGLWRLRDGVLTRFTTANGLSNPTTGALYPDREGNLWIGTTGGGLNRFRNGRFSVYTTRQGLFSDRIYEILEDDSGWLWMTSLRGIFRVHRKDFDDLDAGKRTTLSCLAYGKPDGLTSEVCSLVAKPASWKSKDGRLWFATAKGLCVIDPNAQTEPPACPPPVILERVLADKRPFPAAETLPISGPIRIPPGRGELEFQYTALNLRVPERTRFQYMLEGVDPEWVNAGSRRVAYYNHIYPGKYRFRVIACSPDGSWNETGAEAQLVLLPHVWQTWWFKLALAGGGGLLALGLHRFRLTRFRELQALRLRLAADLHDEVGSNLSAISLLARKMQKTDATREEQAEDLTTLNRIATQTASSIREIVWFINPEYDTFQDLVFRMKELVNVMLPDTDCRFQFSEEHLSRKLPLQLRQNLFLLYKEALTNVAKHARASHVEVTISARDHAWELSVRDDGVGFAPDAPQDGNGLKNMRLRAARLKGSLAISSLPSRGTTVTFTMKAS